MSDIKNAIAQGKTVLGIEFGSTRIKAVLTDMEHNPIASGGHTWENRLENGVWTYSLEDIWGGLQDCYAKLKKDRIDPESYKKRRLCLFPEYNRYTSRIRS